MTRINVRAEARSSVQRPIDDLWAAVDTVPAMTSLMSVIVACDPLDGGGWRWDLGQRGAVGLNVRVTFDVTVEHNRPDLVTFEAIGDAARWASGGGRVTLVERGGSTDVHASVALDLDLSVPGLLRSPLGKIIGREVQNAVDDFVRRWADQAK